LENLDKTVAQRLSVQYIMALSLVALLTVFGQFLVHNTLSTSQDDSHIINIAGRQRMLSQKMTKIALVLKDQQVGTPLYDSSLVKLNASFEEWEQVHTNLQKNNITKPRKYNVTNSQVILSYFSNIDPFFQNLHALFSSCIKNKPTSEVISKILENEGPYLSWMDKIVTTYDKEATKRVNTVKSYELILGFLTLGTLFVEALMIFGPLVEYVKQVIFHLTKSEKKLTETNTQLRYSNKMLLETQKQLEEASKEKYESKLKEENIRNASLLEGQEEERKRLSQEMHDGVGQMLTGIKLSAEKLASMDPNNPKFAIRQTDLLAQIKDTIEATRGVSFNLMPSVLKDYGLESVLKILKVQTEKNSSIVVNYEFSSGRLPNKLEIGIYRIIQEALNNTLKHAEAKVFSINVLTKAGLVYVELSDDGKGFDPEKIKEQSLIHNGVANMKTRTKLLHGTFKVISNLNEGTNIFIKLPLES
jgi:signal transduction histidine kinase